MFKNATPIIIKAITPVHAGRGRELGLVDMPIQKESHTGIPKIEGSSIKGCMREHYEPENENERYKLFGSEDGQDGAGLIGFSDAKLLFYPIKSLHNLFSYVTCPYLLNRFIEDLKMSPNNKNCENLPKIDSIGFLAQGNAIVFNNDAREKKDTKNEKDITGEKIVLDVFSFTTISKDNETLKYFYKKLKLQRDLIVLNDEDFSELIALNREIITRNRIGKNGIVEKGGLFTEEYLPAESILYTLLLVNGIIKDDGGRVENYKKTFPKTLQIGGNSNIGKGIVKMEIFQPKGDEQNG